MTVAFSGVSGRQTHLGRLMSRIDETSRYYLTVSNLASTDYS